MTTINLEDRKTRPCGFPGKALFLGTALSLLLAVGCSSSSPSVAPDEGGGPVTGAADMHCSGDGGVISTPIGMCMCGTKTETVQMCIAGQTPGATSKLSADDGGSDDGASDIVADASGDGTAGSDDAADDAGDAGGDDGAQPPVSDYGPTLYNAQGADDDCKYDVQWTASPIRQNTNVTFTVTVKRRADNGAPETGGDVTLEIFLTDTHPGNTGNAVSTESPAGSGIYKVGPARFDMPGKWNVRFHFNELCSDEPKDSPHGHAAFFVNVP